MGDPEPEVAIASLGGLREARIPYTVVIVPWPFPSRETMLEDLRSTVLFAASHDPALIQVSLPGYTRFFSQGELFDHAAVWSELRSAVRELRALVACPVVLRPGLFEEYEDPAAVAEATVSGVVRNSPAARAGVRPGDQLCRVNGLAARTRGQARSLLTVLHRRGVGRSSVSVRRGGEALDLDLELSDFDSPYDPETGTHLGIVFPSSGIPREWVERLRQVVVDRSARRVLLLTSVLARPTVERLVRETAFPRGVELQIRVPRNGYFGGNILLGDLLVVQDFVDAVEAFAAEGGRQPDLVALPSSPFHLSRWGRDLLGTEYVEIERRTGVPVALVECDPIFD